MEYFYEIAHRFVGANHLSAQQLAVWHQTLGTTDQAIAQASEAFLLNRNAPRQHSARQMPAALLAWLFLLRGDVAQTRRWLDELAEPSLAENFALMLRDWPRYRELLLAEAAAKTQDSTRQVQRRDSESEDSQFTNHLTIGRLARVLLFEGKTQQAERLIQRLADAKSDAGSSVPIVNAMCLCERPELGLSVARRDCHPAVAWPIDQTRLELHEAQLARVDFLDEDQPLVHRLVHMVPIDSSTYTRGI